MSTETNTIPNSSEVISPISMNLGRITTTGKRKNAVAALQYDVNKIKNFTINEKSWLQYFPQERHQLKILAPFRVTEVPLFPVKLKVHGGGTTAQAEAVRHAISKLLKTLNPLNSKNLKKLGYITRDGRRVERQKPGQRGARAAFNSKKR